MTQIITAEEIHSIDLATINKRINEAFIYDISGKKITIFILHTPKS